jgi:hypothetical protein
MEMMWNPIRMDQRIERGGLKCQRLFDPLSPSIPRQAFSRYGLEGHEIGSFLLRLYISQGTIPAEFSRTLNRAEGEHTNSSSKERLSELGIVHKQFS